MTDLLTVDSLAVTLQGHPPTHLLRGVSLSVARGETLALVGESGSGKSLTAFAIMGLLDPPLAISAGAIRFDGQDLAAMSAHDLRAIRGRRIGLVFQEPMTALNPVLTIGDQLIEAVRAHERISSATARRRAIELLTRVRLPDPARLLDSYPHRLSGGQRQRVVIAIAIAGAPDLLIADEPTTAVDATIQAQLLQLLRSLRDELGLAILLITHNLGIVAELADRVAVMYAGRIIEQAPVAALFAAPAHPYTAGLLAAAPTQASSQRLVEIPGLVPAMDALPPGCPFHPRCPRAIDACRAVEPALDAVAPGRFVACIRAAMVPSGVLD
jgi:peptide/nickel transport system ATP-binding protein